MSISDDEVEAAWRVLKDAYFPGARNNSKNMAPIRAALSAAAKVRAIREGDGEGFPRLRTVRAHKHTCANVQPGSTIADKCDCGALDTAGNAIEIAASPIPATGGEKE